MKAKGFTLVEILIVVVILGILAAIVIPQFTEASTEAKEARLVSDLQTVRSQIELYKIEHNDNVPWMTLNADEDNALTVYTDVDGVQQAGPGVDIYGRYLERMPKNPWNNKRTVTEAAVDTGVAGDDGWFFNTATGEFRADDTLSTDDGTAHIDL
jgi:general secretion pathway protein G